jgi:hypothetical protein
MNTTSLRSRALASLIAGLLVSSFAPPLRAEDDDMPDGDGDVVEKPKKKEEKKKDPPKKKEEPKKEPKKETKKKDEPKPEPKPEPKEPPKRGNDNDDDDALPAGDDDILTAPKKEEPKKEPPAKKADPKADLLSDVLADDDEDDLPARPRETPKAERAPLASTPLDDDAVPSRTDRSVNINSDVDASADRAAKVDDAPARAVDDDAPRAPRTSTATVVETEIEEPDETEGAPTGLIVGGAVGGALVVLAGAGVGGYFLVQALASGGTGTVVVTPR